MYVCVFLLTDPEISFQDLFKQSVDEDEMYENPGASEPVAYVSLTKYTPQPIVTLLIFEQEQPISSAQWGLVVPTMVNISTVSPHSIHICIILQSCIL